jgi:hypothetical protein
MYCIWLMHELRGVGVRGEEGDAWLIHELRGVGVRGEEGDAWLIMNSEVLA